MRKPRNALRRGEEKRRETLSLLAILPEDGPEAAQVRAWLAEHKERTEALVTKLNRYVVVV